MRSLVEDEDYNEEFSENGSIGKAGGLKEHSSEHNSTGHNGCRRKI